MLVNMKEMLEEANRTQTAVGAFNCTTLESARAAIEAAEELGMPFVLQHTSVHDEFITLDIAGPIMLALAKQAKIPVCVHLDHGESLECAVKAMHMGFTSVMIDAGENSFEENVRETADVVRIAHSLGVTVEAELGSMPHNLRGELGEYAPEDYYTDPAMAAQFVERTGIDALAISFGTIHGLYPGKPTLDFSIAKKVAESTGGMPLVMHGASGLSDEDYRNAIVNGIRKINYYTYMSLAGAKAVKEYIDSKKEGDSLFYHDIPLIAIEAMKENVKEAINIFSLEV